MRDLFHRLWRIAGHGIHAPRLGMTMLLFGYGLVLVVLSALFQVSFLAHKDGLLPVREVGFLAAPNWALTALVVWPAMFYVLRALIDNAQLVFEDLDGSPMTWLAGTGPLETVASTWARHKRLLRRLAVIILVLCLLGTAIEWWCSSGGPLLRGERPTEGELDWSSLYPDGASASARAGQAFFTLLAFLYSGVAIALMLTFAVAVVLMARTMGLHGAGLERPPLLIDIESNDPSNRVGFERFVVVIDYMIVFVALAFLNFFLTRVQNAYLRDIAHSSIGDFVGQDFLVRKVEEFPELLQISALDFSSAAVSVGAVVAMFQCFFFFNATLRHAALQARNRSDHILIRPDMLRKAKASGLDAGGVRERLRTANVWPLGYSDIMPTLSLLTICALVIVFYRVGVYLVFLWILGWIVARAAGSLIRRS